MRYTFKQIQDWAERNSWVIERDGRKYRFWKVDENGNGPVDGVEYEESRLDEAYATMYYWKPLPQSRETG